MAYVRDSSLTMGLAALLVGWPGAAGCMGDQRSRDDGGADGSAVREDGGDAGGQPDGLGEAADVGDCPEVDYRDDLDDHPGCTVEGLDGPLGLVPGFRCAAVAYEAPTEDPDLPVVVLVHSNGGDPRVWEPRIDPSVDPPGPEQGAPMLADVLTQAGFLAFAVDLRTDRVCEVDDCGCSDSTICNLTRTVDHGWAVPLVMHLIEAVMAAHRGRQVSIVAHGFGATVVRDAIRRLTLRGVAVLARLEDVVLLAGLNHGISDRCGWDRCGMSNTARGRCGCELGFQDEAPTCFVGRLNGPGGAWEAPCADGRTAYGRNDACGGHRVRWTTVVMADEDASAIGLSCSSEATAALAGADNLTLGPDAVDRSDYWLGQAFVADCGAARSREAIELVLRVLTD